MSESQPNKMANIQYILYAFMLILAAAINNYIDNNNYELYNREIIYNKWEKTQVDKPIVYLRGNNLNSNTYNNFDIINL
jgi:hypothetical protein